MSTSSAVLLSSNNGYHKRYNTGPKCESSRFVRTAEADFDWAQVKKRQHPKRRELCWQMVCWPPPITPGASDLHSTV